MIKTDKQIKCKPFLRLANHILEKSIALCMHIIKFIVSMYCYIYLDCAKSEKYFFFLNFNNILRLTLL